MPCRRVHLRRGSRVPRTHGAALQVVRGTGLGESHRPCSRSRWPAPPGGQALQHRRVQSCIAEVVTHQQRAARTRRQPVVEVENREANPVGISTLFQHSLRLIDHHRRYIHSMHLHAASGQPQRGLAAPARNLQRETIVGHQIRTSREDGGRGHVANRPQPALGVAFVPAMAVACTHALDPTSRETAERATKAMGMRCVS